MKKQNTYNEDKLPDTIEGIDVVQDIDVAIDCLRKGQTIVRYEFGDSMMPILTSGQFCKLIPIVNKDDIKQGDCVFALVNGSIGTHMVWMITENETGKYYCIATTQGAVIGWTTEILAKAIGIDHYAQESKKKYKKISAKYDENPFMNTTATSLSAATLDALRSVSRDGLRMESVRRAEPTIRFATAPQPSQAYTIATNDLDDLEAVDLRGVPSEPF